MGAAYILVVDDYELGAILLCNRLRELGYEAAAAGDSIQAAARIQQRKPDLMILDVAMPGGSGTDVHARLQSNLHTAGIPVIFLTALPLDLVQKKIPPSPRVRFHRKPMDFPALKAQIAELLGPKAAASDPKRVP